jgi:hypothetical protein
MLFSPRDRIGAPFGLCSFTHQKISLLCIAAGEKGAYILGCETQQIGMIHHHDDVD